MSQLQIPCKVCKDPATGVHYGIFSCDACKGFFGRQVRRQFKKHCFFKGQCNTKRSGKHVCAACRYKKCLDAGMSKEGIKTGRYTLKWKSFIQEEAQRTEGNQAMTAENRVRDTENQLRLPDNRVRDTANRTREAEARSSMELQVRLQLNMKPDLSEQSLQELIHTLIGAHSGLPSNLRYSKEWLETKTELFWEEYNLKLEMFGKMPSVPTAVFVEIFNATGLDIDDRFQFGSTYLESVRVWMDSLVGFSRSIPGFKELPMKDQYHLLKLNVLEFWYIGAYKGYNVKLKTAFHPFGYCFHKDELTKIFSSAVGDELFELASILQRTDLTSEEHILIQAIVLLFPDRTPLKNRAAVEAIQSTLVTCLEYLISKRPSPQDRVRGLSQAFGMLTAVRRLADLDIDEKIKAGWDGVQEVKWSHLEHALLGSVQQTGAHKAIAQLKQRGWINKRA